MPAREELVSLASSSLALSLLRGPAPHLELLLADVLERVDPGEPCGHALALIVGRAELGRLAGELKKLGRDRREVLEVLSTGRAQAELWGRWSVALDAGWRRRTDRVGLGEHEAWDRLAVESGEQREGQRSRCRRRRDRESVRHGINGECSGWKGRLQSADVA